MKKFVLSLIICSIFLQDSCVAFNYDLVYWDFPPYIYTKDNKAQGIFKESYDYMDNTCNHSGSLKPKVRLNSYDQFNTLISDENVTNDYTQHPYLKNATGHLSFWFPVFTHDIDPVKAKMKNLYYYDFFSIYGMAIFARREDITLTYKVYLSLKESWTFLVLLLTLCAVPAGLIIWFLEHRKNENIKNTFIHGSLKAFWLSLVTMTTVGYGDVASKTLIGRLFTVLWMLFGLIIASSMTALASEGYYQTRHLGIKDNTVGVLKGSFLRDTVRSNWDCSLIEFDSYEEVLQGLRDGVSKIAVINAETAAFLQDEMNTNKSSEVALSIVEIITDISIIVGAYMSYVQEQPDDETLTCMNNAQEYGIKNGQLKHKRKAEVIKIHFPSLAELLLEENIWLILLMISCSVVVIGITIDLLCFAKIIKVKGWFYKNEEKSLQPTENDENKSLEFHTLPACYEELSRLGVELTNINDELTSITEFVEKETIRKNHPRKNIFIVKDKFNEMMY